MNAGYIFYLESTRSQPGELREEAAVEDYGRMGVRIKAKE